MAKPGATQPDLVSELSRLQSRLDALERRPAPTSLYDTYPVMEWAAQHRANVSGNLWSSCGIANVTGLKFDRVEAKFITDYVVSTRSEAEVRLAAFKHSHTTWTKTCIGASSTVRLTGNWVPQDSNRGIGIGKWRWIHGLPSGWNADDDDADSIYTIELQHRNPDDVPRTPDDSNEQQVFSFGKKQNEDGTRFQAVYVSDAGSANEIAAGLSWTGDSPAWGWYTIPDTTIWNGAYSISNMHYCVGMSAEQLPEATANGWFWYSGGDVEFVRQPNTEEGYIRF